MTDEIPKEDPQIIHFNTTDKPPEEYPHKDPYLDLGYLDQALKDFYKPAIEQQLNHQSWIFHHIAQSPGHKAFSAFNWRNLAHWKIRTSAIYHDWRERIHMCWKVLRGENPYDYLDD